VAFRGRETGKLHKRGDLQLKNNLSQNLVTKSRPEDETSEREREMLQLLGQFLSLLRRHILFPFGRNYATEKERDRVLER